MRDRRRARRFERVRQHGFSKLCALWFIVLIVLPFTAPFPTYQLSTSGHPFDALPKDVKDKVGSDEELAVSSAWSLVPPAVSAVVAGSVTRLNQQDEHPPQHTVLRL